MLLLLNQANGAYLGHPSKVTQNPDLFLLTHSVDQGYKNWRIYLGEKKVVVGWYG